jgi:hypothetical protein
MKEKRQLCHAEEFQIIYATEPTIKEAESNSPFLK